MTKAEAADPCVAAGGQPDGDEDELLIDGQEEVFSRTEVGLGRIEHGVGEADLDRPERGPFDDRVR